MGIRDAQTLHIFYQVLLVHAGAHSPPTTTRAQYTKNVVRVKQK